MTFPCLPLRPLGTTTTTCSAGPCATPSLELQGATWKKKNTTRLTIWPRPLLLLPPPRLSTSVHDARTTQLLLGKRVELYPPPRTRKPRRQGQEQGREDRDNNSEIANKSPDRRITPSHSQPYQVHRTKTRLGGQSRRAGGSQRKKRRRREAHSQCASPRRQSNCVTEEGL